MSVEDVVEVGGVISRLQRAEPLDARHRDHALAGNRARVGAVAGMGYVFSSDALNGYPDRHENRPPDLSVSAQWA